MTLMANDKDNKKKKQTQDETKFKPGNRFWEARASHGRETIFESPTAMWEAAVEYFTWVQDNPLQGAALHEGKVVMVPKMQAMTMRGLCLFLHVNDRYFSQFKNRVEERLLADPKGNNDINQFDNDTEFSTIITNIETVIYTQKFTGAAAGLLNGNLISKEIGLQGKIELNHKNNGGKFETPVNNVVIRMPHNNRELVPIGKKQDGPTPGTEPKQSQ